MKSGAFAPIFSAADAGAATRLAAASANKNLRMALSSQLRIAFVRCLRLRVQQGERARIRLRLIESREPACEQSRRFDKVEQGQAGPQLERIDRPQDLFGAALSGPPQQHFDGLAQTSAKQRIREIGSGLI